MANHSGVRFQRLNCRRAEQPELIAGYACGYAASCCHTNARLEHRNASSSDEKIRTVTVPGQTLEREECLRSNLASIRERNCRRQINKIGGDRIWEYFSIFYGTVTPASAFPFSIFFIVILINDKRKMENGKYSVCPLTSRLPPLRPPARSAVRRATRWRPGRRPRRRST